MALALKLDTRISKDCLTLYISDVTRSYQAITNPGGYDSTGVVNLDPNDIDTDTGNITFENSAGETASFDLDPSDFVVANIDTTGLISVSFTFEDLTDNGFSSADDDVIKITYSFYDTNDTLYQKSCYIVKNCTACCILNTLTKAIDFCGECGKKNVTAQINEVMMARIILESASLLAACNDIQGAKEALDYVNTLGEDHRCSSCN